MLGRKGRSGRKLIPDHMRDPSKRGKPSEGEAPPPGEDGAFREVQRLLGLREDRAAALVMAATVGLFCSIVAMFVAAAFL